MFCLAESHDTGDPAPYLQAAEARVHELQQAGIVETVYLRADRAGVGLARNGAGFDLALGASILS